MSNASNLCVNELRDDEEFMSKPSNHVMMNLGIEDM